jgi:hypothetical protein
MADNILDIENNPGSSYQYLYGTVRTNTNVQGGNIAQQAAGAATLAVAGAAGLPQVAQVGQSLIGESENYSIYRTYTAVPFNNLNNLPGVKFQDFRARKGLDSPGAIADAVRLDGASAATRLSPIAAAYAAANLSPAGPYSIFNREADKGFGAGWGDHDNPYALRLDFTAQSSIVTKWKGDGWKLTTNPLELATPFRGDRVQVIDFGKRALKDAYKWKPSALGLDLPGPLGMTQDFIKFYMTGPKLLPDDNDPENKDDIIVFRAIMDSLTDSFQANWNAQQMIGRADPNYHYTGYGRSISLGFSVYATDRDEMKPIWRKLNALAGYTAPEYIKSSIAMKAPWMRITIGDIFVQQPVIITSLSYTLHDADTTWEINIEQDPTMMQAPKKVSVTMDMNIITNELPQKNGKFYSLAKNFDKNGQSKPGNDNWLSDFESNPPVEQTAAERDAQANAT